MYYNYLCSLSDPLCGCPDGRECVVGLSDDLYATLVREGLLQEVDTFCYPLDNPDVPAALMPSVSGDTFTLMTDWVCEIGVGYGCVGCPPPPGGGSEGIEPCPGCDTIRNEIRPTCLEQVLWERNYTVNVWGYSFKEYAGLFYDPNEDHIFRDGKPVILLVHGLNSGCSVWEDTYVPWLRNQGYKIASVDLFRVNAAAPDEFRGGGFYPNTKLLDSLVNMLHRYLSNHERGNKDIYVIAHSRGGLETEAVLMLRRNPYIKKVVTIGTPFYGSTLANLCVIFEGVFNCGMWDFTCHAVKAIIENIGGDAASACGKFFDAVRLTTWNTLVWRQLLGSPPSAVRFNVGIGWTESETCGGFSLTARIGCLLMLYFGGSGCNDGAVDYSSTRRRYENYRSTTDFISTPPDVSWLVRCHGDPGDWRKDHSASVRDYTIFRDYVLLRLEEDPSIFHFAANYGYQDGTEFDILSFLTEPAESYSSMLLSFIPTIGMRPLNITDTAIVASSVSLNIEGAVITDTFRASENLKAYVVYPMAPHGIIVSPKLEGEEEITSATVRSLLVMYPNGIPAVLRTDRKAYLPHQPVDVELFYPGSYTATLVVWRHRDSSRARVVHMTPVGDTLRARIVFDRPGIYNLVAWTGGWNPRTVSLTILVLSEYSEWGLYEVLGMEDLARNIRRVEDTLPRTESGFVSVGKEYGVYRIYNVSGSLVRQGRFSNGRIPIDDLKHGVYFIKVDNRVIKVVR